MFDENSRWQPFVDLAWQRTSKQNGFANETDCAGIVAGRSLGDVTCARAFEYVETSRNWDVSWTAWMALFMRDTLSPSLRARLMRSLAGRDAPCALGLCGRATDLQRGEVDALAVATETHLPHMRKTYRELWGRDD